MSEHFESSLAWVLAQEGGFAKLAKDEITNLGVKKTVWEEWTGKKKTEADMRKLKIADVAPLYRKNYYEATSCPKIVYPLSLCVFDFAVNSGPGRALQGLSYLSGVSLDTKMRDKMIATINELPDKKRFINQFLDWRVNFLRNCRNYNLYGRGWEARVARLRTHAMDMIDHPEKIPAQ